MTSSNSVSALGVEDKEWSRGPTWCHVFEVSFEMYFDSDVVVGPVACHHKDPAVLMWVPCVFEVCECVVP